MAGAALAGVGWGEVTDETKAVSSSGLTFTIGVRSDVPPCPAMPGRRGRRWQKGGFTSQLEPQTESLGNGG